VIDDGGAAPRVNPNRNLATATSADAMNLSSTPKSRSNASNKLYTQGGPMFHRTALAFAILASATTFSAFAETAEERQACTNDAQTLCADDIPDRDRVYGCLVRKVNQLSPACKKIISTSIASSKPKR
jgi:hypothetical protein